MTKTNKIDSLGVYCALYNMGFNIRGWNKRDGASDESPICPFDDLGLNFQGMPKIADIDSVYVTQNDRQIQVSMSLGKYLDIMGIHPPEYPADNIIPFPAA